MNTPNRHYPLPNKNHDVVDDINDLRSTFGAIDSDVQDSEERIEELSETVSDLENRAVHLSYSIENSEIQNISANRYLVVNSDGDGFECLDGGGDVGGKLGQSSIKKTDANFDTAWGNVLEISKNGMTVQENSEKSQSNETHIFADESEIENEEQLPKIELTNCQAKSDLEAINNESVIFCDNAEEIEEELPIATHENFGLVKVGSGFTNDTGTISAPIISKATTEEFGIIKTGNGLINNNGIISRDTINPATYSNFGVVKLGENLSINASGQMEIDDMGNAATIYDLGRIKICNNGIVDIEEQTLQYRLFVTEDLVIQFKLDFEPREDFSFVLELVSYDSYIVAFNENLNPKMTTLPVSRGTTKIKFTKKLGVPSYGFEISRLDAPEPVLLTPKIDSCISSEFMVTSEGGSWLPNDILKTDYDGYCDIRELNFKFETLVCVDYVNYLSRSSSVAMGEFVLKGSSDGKNWTTLIYKNGEIIYGKIYTELKGCFRYFNLKIGYTSDDNKPGGVTLWGTQIDNNESEIIPITPYMGSNETAFATMTTSNNIVEGSAANITDFSSGTYLIMEKTNDNWIKFEFPIAKIANILELNYWVYWSDWNYNGDRQPNWFQLLGSNDDENWTLLLEKQYQGRALEKENYVLFFEFNNQTAYRYYKFVCVATNSINDRWNICGLKLYRRDRGKHNFYRGVPKLSSANQDGYEVTGSSQWDNGSAPYYAFDDDKATRWVAAANEGISWLQIKLPSATVCNVARITSRPESVDVNQAPTSFEIQGSNDGETWDTLTSQSGVTWTSAGETQSFNFSDNETAYLYYRLYITANGGGPAHALAEFVIGRSAYEYKRYLDKYEYLVPVMSANSQNGYVVSAKSNWGSHYPWKAFDRSVSNSDDAWECNDSDRADSNGNCDTWLQIQLPEAKVVNALYLQERNGKSTRDPKDFTLQASNNGTTWTTLLAQTDQSYTDKAWEFDNDVAYLYYRLCITKSNQASDNVCVGIMNLLYHEIITEY